MGAQRALKQTQRVNCSRYGTRRLRPRAARGPCGEYLARAPLGYGDDPDILTSSIGRDWRELARTLFSASAIQHPAGAVLVGSSLSETT